MERRKTDHPANPKTAKNVIGDGNPLGSESAFNPSLNIETKAMKMRIILLVLGTMATFTGWSQPIITNQPQSLTNIAGTTAMFSVGATGTEPLSYQWQFNSSWLSGETNVSLTLSNVQSGSAGVYSVIITNLDGAATSDVATLTVLLPPSFTSQPVGQSVSVGANPVFSFTAGGTPPLYYHFGFQQTNDLPGGVSLVSPFRGTLAVSNAQVGNAGDYVVIVTNVAGAATSQVAHLDVDPTFSKITTGSIVTEPGTYLACAWGDYDNDGFPDLIVTCANSGAPQRNVLFHNNGDGTFTKTTSTAITAESRDWRGCAWVDYDNDGNLDLLVVSDSSGGFAAANELFRNNGNGTFTKITLFGGGNSDGPAWADYDRDGFVDVFVAGFGLDLLFHNNADGTFSRVLNPSGLPLNNQGGFRAMWGDYDNDGWPDLFVQVSDPSATPGASVAYHALGGGVFTNFVPGLQKNYTSGSGCAPILADYDNDGFPDLIVPQKGGHPNLVYHNNGNGSFTLMTSNQVGSIASDLLNAYLCAWGDYDNDGFLDVFLLCSTGGILYHNNGAGGFTRVVTGSPVNDFINSAVSATWVDYDGDGFLDLFVPNNGAGNLSTNLLYRNNGNTNGWLKVKLQGTASNRSGIGAKVRVQATIGGRSMWQLREINTGDGFSGPPLEAHFGLGDATNIDQVRIEWPSGIVQVLTNVTPRRFITVTEHQQTPTVPLPPLLSNVSREPNGAVDMAATGDSGLLYVFEASTNLVNWTKIGVRSNATGAVSFTDARSAGFGNRFYRVSIP